MKITEKSKKYLFVIVIVLICLTHFISASMMPKMILKGSFNNQIKPILTVNSWFSGNYQQEQEKYLNENYGLRDLLVRIYNQINFSFFKQTNANDVIVGKEDYLYEEKYVQAYLGRDFIGSKKIRERIKKLKMVQDTLAQLNIDLMVVLAAGKASFFPEYIPDRYNPTEKDTSNYDIMKIQMENQGVAYLDFNRWFCIMKDTSRYNLFPKNGIHWSKYGEVIAGDSIIKFIDKKREVKLFSIEIDTVITSYNMWDTDDDIEKAMNLLFDLPDLEMPYAQFKFVKNEANPCFRLLSVADSYFWGMFNYGLSREVFNDGEFWFYNNEIYPPKDDVSKKVADIDFQQEIEKNDVIMLMSTEINFNNFSFGFIDKAYKIYFKNYAITPTDQPRINYYIQKIKSDSAWLSYIKKQCIEKKLSLEKAIQQNAEYMVKEEKTNKF